MADESGIARTNVPGSAASPVPFQDGTEGIAAPESLVVFQERFLRLLERRTAIYTMGESTSVPKHVAVDLLRSVSFVLGVDPERPEIPERLLAVDLEDEFRRNLADIERNVELTGRLWREVGEVMPPIPSTALHDTLASIGDFPRLYDFRSMAHEIPCTIDYPLCHPVAETLAGVDYVNEYLARLLIEADFLRRFETEACSRVLERVSRDYVDLPVNLYEPIAANAIGRAVIGQDPSGLIISDEGRARIARRLGPLGNAERTGVIREGALAVCDALGIGDDDARRYVEDVTPELLPRIEVGLARGELRGVFVG